jgi:hypothetical protein
LPERVIIYPEKSAQLRSLDFRLYDLMNNPIRNELFFFETDDPDQAPDPNANRFDGHRLRTKIYKRYMIIFFRINDEQTGKFVIDCKTDIRANFVLRSVFNSTVPAHERHKIPPATKTFNFFNIL